MDNKGRRNMSGQGSISIGEDCLAKLDELMVFLKRARRKSFLSIDLLGLIVDLFVNRDLKKAEKLAGEVRTALESFKASLVEDGTSHSDAIDKHHARAIDCFFDLVWNPSNAMIKSKLEATKNARSAVLHF